MALPAEELKALERLGLEYEALEDSGMSCLIIRSFPLPGLMSGQNADLLIRLNPGFPDVPPDMWWFDPAVMRTDNVIIPATDHFENHFGRRWQRWSRHFESGQWQSGVDSLESFLALIRAELARHAPPAAACA